MNEKFNKNAKVEQLTKVVLSHGEEKDLIVKDPFVDRSPLKTNLLPVKFSQNMFSGSRCLMKKRKYLCQYRGKGDHLY